ncbi:MAG: ABC transporter ATP-binding protein [Thermogemmatispora sp.]|uniref:ABC transporter ATP-binding protein n=1 Tax=Thermogemmatispora sp. TaxID=1968838 RepID=UPI002619B4B5|nr:ABC transporter ATP-binding protein [Thermogemmatispora sp.]MBX5455496.1 ABC transporter ATP-binding protein [Thermogemmatispora sp.]
MQAPLLEVRQLSRRFGTFTAVDSVSFAVPAGQIVGLLGPNGAGKTTLLSMLVGLLPPTTGTILLNGEELQRVPPRKKSFFGFVPDSQEVIDHLTGLEYLQFLRRIYRLSEEQWSLVGEYLALLRLEEKAHHLLETYSHGQRKKLQIIAALLHQPRLLLLDEPLSGLDPEITILVKRLLRRLRERAVGVLVSTHDLLMAQDLCDEVILLHRGRVVAQGAPQSLLEHYAVANLEEAFLQALGLGQQDEELDHVLARF